MELTFPEQGFNQSALRHLYATADRGEGMYGPRPLTFLNPAYDSQPLRHNMRRWEALPYDVRTHSTRRDPVPAMRAIPVRGLGEEQGGRDADVQVDVVIERYTGPSWLRGEYCDRAERELQPGGLLVLVRHEGADTTLWKEPRIRVFIEQITWKIAVARVYGAIE